MSLPNRAFAFASRWFDDGTVRGTFEPLIADWQREWQDAPAGRRWRISVLGWSAFVCAVIVSSPQIARTAAPSQLTNHVVTRMARFTLLSSVMLVIPIIAGMTPAWVKGLMVLFTVPGALVTAFPFSVVAAVDVIRGSDKLPPHVERAAAIKLAIASVALMVCFSGWVTPAANVAWRRAVAPAGIGAPARGFRELNTYELVVDPSRAHAKENTNLGGRGAALQRELHNRAAMALLPLIFIWLRWGSLDRVRMRRWYSPMGPVGATLAAIAGFVSLWYCAMAIEIGRALPPGIALWLPAVALIACGIGARLLAAQAVLRNSPDATTA